MRAPSRGIPRDVLATSTSFTGHTSVFSAATASTEEEKELPLSFILFSLEIFSLYRTPTITFAESINALASTLSGISAIWDRDDTELVRTHWLFIPLLLWIAADG